MQGPADYDPLSSTLLTSFYEPKLERAVVLQDVVREDEYSTAVKLKAGEVVTVIYKPVNLKKWLVQRRDQSAGFVDADVLQLGREDKKKSGASDQKLGGRIKLQKFTKRKADTGNPTPKPLLEKQKESPAPVPRKDLHKTTGVAKPVRKKASQIVGAARERRRATQSGSVADRGPTKGASALPMPSSTSKWGIGAALPLVVHQSNIAARTRTRTMGTHRPNTDEKGEEKSTS